MKFCKYCGKQLEDNEVCSCQQPATPVQPVQQPVQQPVNPYQAAAPVAPAQPNKFALAFKNFPTIFLSYWNNSKRIADIAKKEKDWALATILSGTFFLALLIMNLFFYKTFNFGISFLFALVMTITVGGFYVMSSFLVKKIFNKGISAKEALLDSYIEFSVHSLMLSCLYIVTAIASLISMWFGMFFVVFSIAYLLVVYLGDMRVSLGDAANKTWAMAIVAGIFMVALVICLVLALVFFSWSMVDVVSNAFGSYDMYDFLY